MLDVKSGARNRLVRLRSTSTSSIRGSQIQRLQDEIDKLALLVHEAKKQSDRIQAAADAFGDLILLDPESTGASDIHGRDDKFERPLKSSATAKSRTRASRSLRVPTESADLPGALTR
jgi:hypothetical protein